MIDKKDQASLANLRVRVKTLKGLASNLVFWTNILEDSYDKDGCLNLMVLNAMLLTLELIREMALSSAAFVQEFKEKRDDR